MPGGIGPPRAAAKGRYAAVAVQGGGTSGGLYPPLRGDCGGNRRAHTVRPYERRGTKPMGRTKGGRVRPLLGSTPNKGPVVAALYKGGCVGAAMSRPPFRFSALSVGAGPRPARRIAGKPDAERIPCGRMVSVSAGDETGKHGADHIRPYGVTAAGIRGRTLCAPTEKGLPNRWGPYKRGGAASPGEYTQ